MRNSRWSWPFLATSIKPTGSPPSRGNGREIAHRSKKFTQFVLGPTKAFLAKKPSTVITSDILGGRIFTVGSTMTSISLATRQMIPSTPRRTPAGYRPFAPYPVTSILGQGAGWQGARFSHRQRGCCRETCRPWSSRLSKSCLSCIGCAVTRLIVFCVSVSSRWRS